MTDENKPMKWLRPAEVLQQMKRKKKALQNRLNLSGTQSASSSSGPTSFENVLQSKRKNPFASKFESDAKKCKPDIPDESNDNSLFKLLHMSNVPSDTKCDKFSVSASLVNNSEATVTRNELKVIGEKWIPVDWSIKTKVRFLSRKPFQWNQKLKISEEASGITSFTRCLNATNNSCLDTSANSKFHQCCLYWQFPSLPWLNLFPRMNAKSTNTSNFSMNLVIKEALHLAFTDSLRSLFHLIRTRQCPYFYLCANSFTLLIRAAGIGGFSEMHCFITPTTSGFRKLLKHGEIEFTMPFKRKKPEVEGHVDAGHEDEDDDDWFEKMGIKQEDIKQFNNTQAKIIHKEETLVDNCEESLVLIEGHEVAALYGFITHCKSIVSITGQYAGIPPTLLAPVAFNGATVTALKVKESKATLEDGNYYSIDLSGPILPSTIHNLIALHPKENSMTATFSQLPETAAFNKILKKDTVNSLVFRTENLSDCGLPSDILKHFCSDDPQHIANLDCLKYCADMNGFTWT